MQRRVGSPGALLLLVAATLLMFSRTVAAAGALQEQDTWKVVLPKGSQPEGIAAGSGNDLWVACLSGNIIHVDLDTNASTIVHKERGVHLSGAKFCKKQQALFVAGTLAGKAYVYHMQRKPLQGVAVGSSSSSYSMVKREVLDLDLPGVSYINDVALSNDRAYFTDSFNPVLHWASRFDSSSSSSKGRPIGRVNTGPHFDTKAGQFRANGIAVYKSNERKDVLLVANTHTGHLYRVEVDKDAAAGGAGEGLAGGIAVVAARSGVKQLATMAVASRLRKARGSAVAAAQPEDPQQEHKEPQVAVAATTSKDTDAAASNGDDVTTAAPVQPGRWNKLAQDVAAEMRLTTRRKRLGQASQYLSKLARDVSAAMQPVEEETETEADTAEDADADEAPAATSAAAAAVTAAAPPAAAGRPHDAGATASGFTARPSAEAMIQTSGQRKTAGGQHSSSSSAQPAAASSNSQSKRSSWQQPPAQADPVAIAEAKQDVNPALQAAAAAAAAHSSTATRHSVGLGRSLLTSAAKGAEVAASQQPLLLADPVKIPEARPDVNEAVMMSAAAVAAAAAMTAQQRVGLGRPSRSLLASAAAADGVVGWPMPRPAQMARGIANRLGFNGHGKQQIARVTELQLPAIAGKYTKHLLVDGIAIKNDTAFVADNYNNRVWGVDLDKGAAAAHISCSLQGPSVMHVPTTLAFQLGRLWWVNAHLDTCFPFLPCPHHTFELHGVRAAAKCEPWSMQ